MSSTYEREPLASIDIINPNGDLLTVGIEKPDWKVKIGAEVVDCSRVAALCLSVLTQKPNEIISGQQHATNAVDFYAEVITQGAETIPLIHDVDISEKKNKIEEALPELASGALGANIFWLGSLNDGHIFLCDNVLNVDYGLNIINAHFENGLLPESIHVKYLKDFVARFNQFSGPTEIEQKTSKSTHPVNQDIHSATTRSSVAQTASASPSPIVKTKTTTSSRRGKKLPSAEQLPVDDEVLETDTIKKLPIFKDEKSPSTAEDRILLTPLEQQVRDILRSTTGVAHTTQNIRDKIGREKVSEADVKVALKRLYGQRDELNKIFTDLVARRNREGEFTFGSVDRSTEDRT